MYELTVTALFSAAHRVVDSSGELEELHGHNWHVAATVAGDRTDQNGMVIDFAVLKERLSTVLDDFDHKNLSDLGEFRDKAPTSENIAQVIFMKLESLLDGCRLRSISVRETESSSATYTED